MSDNKKSQEPEQEPQEPSDEPQPISEAEEEIFKRSLDGKSFRSK